MLLGWSAGLPVLTGVVARGVGMNPLTALLFMTSGAALAVFHLCQGRPQLRLAVALGGGLVSALGGTRFIAYLVGTQVSFDRILFADKLVAENDTINCMAPTTAFNFALLGAALSALASNKKPHQRAAQFVALGAAMTAFVAIIGFAYSIVSFTRVAAYIPMALPTATCFIFMAVGVLCAVPHIGIMGHITRASAGGRHLRRRLPGFVLVPLCLGWLRIEGERVGIYSAVIGTVLMVGALLVIGVYSAFRSSTSFDLEDALRRQREEHVRKLAYFDMLTGLPNRFLFRDRLTQALARARRRGTEVAVLFIDLDGFKLINDTLGHEAGDVVLQQASRRISACLRTTDTAARLSGDEFTVIIEEVGVADCVELIATRLIRALAQPYPFGQGHAYASASIGISISDRSACDLDRLVSNADQAMYEAKRGGKGRWAHFEKQPAMERK